MTRHFLRCAGSATEPASRPSPRPRNLPRDRLLLRREAADVLPDQAPSLADALEWALADGVPYVISDGNAFASDRCSALVTSVKGRVIEAWYSARARYHGGNVQAVTRPDGLPLGPARPSPAPVHDLTAARRHALYRAVPPMPCLADSGYEGASLPSEARSWRAATFTQADLGPDALPARPIAGWQP